MTKATSTPETIELTQKYVMHTYGRLPVAFVKGEGCYLWDAEGKKYLDLLAGIAVNALGHSHPQITEVIIQQAATLVHTSNLFHVEPQARLAAKLCELSFADKVFFCNSGAEANEAAVKLARRWAKKHKSKDCFEILTAENSFHGRTLGMIAATGQSKIKQGFEPLLPGFKHVPFGDVEALAKNITPQTAAIMLEPVLGEGGVQFPPEGYLQKVRALCDEKQILLILDEIQTGLGRTGKLFAYEHFGITPDILTSAKSLGTGLPMGACLATEAVASAFQPGDHASTFGGNFLVTAVAIKFLEILTKQGLLNHAQEVGVYFAQQLTQLAKDYPWIKGVRAKGLMLGMDLSKEEPGLGAKIVQESLSQGLIINCTQGKTLRFVPPLILTKVQVGEGVEILKSVFSKVMRT